MYCWIFLWSHSKQSAWVAIKYCQFRGYWPSLKMLSPYWSLPSISAKWVPLCDPKMKQQSAQRKIPNSARPRKLRQTKSGSKTFFYINEIVQIVKIHQNNWKHPNTIVFLIINYIRKFDHISKFEISSWLPELK